VLTAAHCDDGKGLYYNYDEIHEYTGVLPASVTCESDADCPNVTIEGQSIPMECDDEVGEHPGSDGSCYLPDETFQYSNFALEASFGEAYNPYGPEQPYNSIPIQYCKVFDEAAGMGFDPDDFAYCILAQEPDVEPVPIIMHCEVDEFLDGSYDLNLVAVGFGKADSEPAANEESGRKRWASSSTDTATLSSSATKVDLDDFASFVPGDPFTGDSGGPTFVQLPDGSWRVLAINTTSGADTAGVPPWKFVTWMLEDDEVLAQIDDLIPCHDDDGTWAPGPECGSFPESPQSGSGEWARGPTACYDSDLSGYSATCGAPYMPFVPPPQSPGFTPPPDESTSNAPSTSRGCSTSNSHGSLVLVGLLALGLNRRRRRAAALTTCLLLFVSGCQDDSPLTEADDEIGDTGSVEPLEINPNVSHVTSGVIFPGDKYEEIAVGNVVRAITSSTCCQDYVIGGETEASVRLLLGGGSTTRGLTFLSSSADQLVTMADMGEGIDDLALVDLDDDNDNDLVALTTNGELAQRLGNATSTPFGSLNQYSATSGMVVGAGKLAVGDMDCDGDPDITVTAPASDAVLILFNNGSGAFNSLEVFEVGESPVDVAVGNLDGNAPLDIVTINSDATMSIGIASTCERPRPEVEDPFEFANYYNPACMSSSCIDTVEGASVEIFTACGGSDNDIVIAVADSVLAFCNEGDGVTFEEGEAGPWTIRWDLNGTGGPRLMEDDPVHSPQLWVVPDAPDALFAVNREDSVITQLSLSANAYGRNFLPVLAIRSGTTPLEMVLSAHTGAGAGWWQRAAWVSDVRTAVLDSDGQIGFGR
jgi:hypothetical protein